MWGFWSSMMCTTRSFIRPVVLLSVWIASASLTAASSPDLSSMWQSGNSVFGVIRILPSNALTYKPNFGVKYLEAELKIGEVGRQTIEAEFIYDAVDHNQGKKSVKCRIFLNPSDFSLSSILIDPDGQSPIEWENFSLVDTIHGPCYVSRFFRLWMNDSLQAPPEMQNLAHIGFSASKVNHNVYLRIWKADDGLAGNPCRDGIIASDGTLWVATIDGLSHFDGYNWRSWTSASYPQLMGGNITAVCEGPDGEIYFAEKKVGIYRLSGEDIIPFALNPRIEGLWLRKMVMSSNGEMLVSADEKELMIIDPVNEEIVERVAFEELYEFPFRPEFEEFTFYHHREITPDRIMISSRSGLKIWDRNSGGLTHLSHVDGVMGPFVEFEDGYLSAANNWVLTINNDFTISDSREIFTKGSINIIQPSIYGGCWIATPEELIYYLDGEVTRFPDVDNEISHFTKLLEDRFGNLWIISAKDGVARLSMPPLKFHDLSNSTKYWQPSVIVDGENDFPGFAGNVVASVNWDGTLHQIYFDEHLKVGAQIRDPADSAGYLAGLSLRRGNSERLKSVIPLPVPFMARIHQNSNIDYITDPNHEFGIGEIYSMVSISESKILLATGDGVYQWDGNQLQLINDHLGIPHFQTSCLLKSHRSNHESLWIGGFQSGLYHLDNGHVKHFSVTESGLLSDSILALHEMPGLGLWVGTAGGLNLIADNGNTYSIVYDANVSNSQVRAIEVDNNGGVWLGFAHGIVLLDVEPLTPESLSTATSTIELNSFSFGTSDGLKNVSVYPGFFPVSATNQKGNVFFSMQNGIAEIDPKYLNHYLRPPEVEFTSVNSVESPTNYLDGFISSGNTRLKLPPALSTLIKFGFRAANVSNPELVTYRYRIREVGDQWMEAGEKTEAYFTNLGPGEFHFEVQAINGNGIQSIGEHVLALMILPHYYQTFWFRSLVILLCFAGIIGVHQAILRTQKRIKELESSLEMDKERSRIARDMHDEFGVSLAGIRMMAEHLSRQIADDKYSDLTSRIIDMSDSTSLSLREII